MIAMQIEAESEDAACTVVGLAPTLLLASRLIEREAIDAAARLPLRRRNSHEIATVLVNGQYPSC